MEINENKSSNINNYGQIGWVCPLCGRIWSPYVRECTCNQFYDPSRITCRIENENGCKSIFEGQNNFSFSLFTTLLTRLSEIGAS